MTDLPYMWPPAQRPVMATPQPKTAAPQFGSIFLPYEPCQYHQHVELTKSTKGSAHPKKDSHQHTETTTYRPRASWVA
jgi:hypothetical protein